MKEIWKDIPGWEDRYQVSNLGRAFSKLKNKNQLLLTEKEDEFGNNQILFRNKKGEDKK